MKFMSERSKLGNSSIYFAPQVEPKKVCNKKLLGEDSKIPVTVLNDILPNGLTPELSCVTNNELTEKNCLADSGSPIIYQPEGTARGIYFEQHFVLSFGLNCSASTMLAVQIGRRSILNWIQNVTGSQPCLQSISGSSVEVSFIAKATKPLGQCEKVTLSTRNLNPFTLTDQFV